MSPHPPTRLIIITDEWGRFEKFGLFFCSSSCDALLITATLGAFSVSSWRHAWVVLVVHGNHFAFLSPAYRPIATQTGSVVIHFRCINVVVFFFCLFLFIF